jgi:hypothetical protein
MTKAEEMECSVCGSRNLMACYGIAFGGLGPYEVCEDCDEVIYKHVKETGLCFNTLDPSPLADPRPPTPDPPPHG